MTGLLALVLITTRTVTIVPSSVSISSSVGLVVGTVRAKGVSVQSNDANPEHPMNREAVVNRSLAAASPVVRAAYRYLSSLGHVLWGDYDISDPVRRFNAAEWLARQYEGVDSQLN